jgi:NAD(P)-dependent dehydrogenase (short-subunit alcohol dehydrogenase family)
MKLAKKKAIVTGANRNIGKGIALAFAKEGADIVISYRSDQKGAEEVIYEIEKIGSKGKAIYADFSSYESIVGFYQKALNYLNNVDILVNNAAVYETSDFLELRQKDFAHMLKINVEAPMILMQITAKDMIQQGIKGSIINISSISGLRPSSKHTAYSTVKAGLNMLTQCAALDLAPYEIRVNAIAPGDTPYEEDEEQLCSHIPLKRRGRPQDQAEMAIYLASDKASWVTGQIYTIDGGQSLSLF